MFGNPRSSSPLKDHFATMPFRFGGRDHRSCHNRGGHQIASGRIDWCQTHLLAASQPASFSGMQACGSGANTFTTPTLLNFVFAHWHVQPQNETIRFTPEQRWSNVGWWWCPMFGTLEPFVLPDACIPIHSWRKIWYLARYICGNHNLVTLGGHIGSCQRNALGPTWNPWFFHLDLCSNCLSLVRLSCPFRRLVEIESYANINAVGPLWLKANEPPRASPLYHERHNLAHLSGKKSWGHEVLFVVPFDPSETFLDAKRQRAYGDPHRVRDRNRKLPISPPWITQNNCFPAVKRGRLGKKGNTNDEDARKGPRYVDYGTHTCKWLRDSMAGFMFLGSCVSRFNDLLCWVGASFRGKWWSARATRWYRQTLLYVCFCFIN